MLDCPPIKLNCAVTLKAHQRSVRKIQGETHTHLHVCSSVDWTSPLLKRRWKRAQRKRKQKECTQMTAVWPENTSPSSDALKSSGGSLFVNVSESEFNFLVMQTLTALKFVYLLIYCMCVCVNLLNAKNISVPSISYSIWLVYVRGLRRADQQIYKQCFTKVFVIR